MKAVSLPISSSFSVPQQRQPAVAPRFGGVGTALSGMVEVLDSNPMFQLFGTDLLSMVVPRSVLALSCRGPDDGRETFLREFSGLIGNVLLMGWAGHATTRMLGDSVNLYNPLGIPARAWITAPTLDAFGKIYKDELEKAGKAAATNQNGLKKPVDYAAEARQGFIRRVLEGLESGDRKFSIESRLCNLEQLDSAPQREMLEQMKKSLPQPEKVSVGECQSLLAKMSPFKGKRLNPTEKATYEGLRQQFHGQFLEAGWGKLSENAVEKKITPYFKLKAPGDSSAKGTVPLDKIAQQRVKDLQRSFSKNQGLEQLVDAKCQAEAREAHPRTREAIQAEVVEQNGFKSSKEFVKQRMALSLNDLRHDSKAFTEAVDGEALLHGLTSTVDLHHQLENRQQIHLSGNRGTLLKEMKHFLEQFVDRAEHAAQETISEKSGWGNFRKKMDDTLFASSKEGFYNKLVPQAQDGLITAAIKSKGAFTWVPLGISIASAGALTFYNNYLTMKKHGGKIFFPGEGMPPVEGALKAPSFLSANRAALAPGAMGVYRNFGTFPNYPQFRNNQGGIIA
jgi:hypothetical protein